jgi:hypothetical protein
MSGITGLVDILLAGKLSQRLDLLGLKSSALVAEPGPAMRVDPAGNDIRLLSHAASQRQIGGAMSEDSRPASKGAPGALLSLAARAISTVLTPIQAEAGPVRGAQAVLPSLQAAPVAMLAGALANVVSTSGMFYESHLLDFASAQLARSQLEQEPQSRLAGSDARKPAAASAPVGFAKAAISAESAAAVGARSMAGPPAAGVIHPEVVTLVHQQLDLLASGVFRWAGEAWPGVPMEWSIHEDSEPRHPNGPDEEDPPRWATTLSLVLPRLGAIDVRLSLKGSSVKAALAVSDAALARLQAEAGDLKQRLASAGFAIPEVALASRTDHDHAR